MPRAIWAAVSGLDNHQTWMDVIGNNIANVNTTGYKNARYQFEDILSQAVRGSAPPVQGGIGGTNPEQVGLGTTTGSIGTDTGQGSLQPTNLPTDIAITGPGYFVLGDGENQHFSRDSVFHVDAAGGIVSSANGLHLQGILADATGSLATGAQQGLRNLTIPQTVNQANNTQLLDLFGNLDSRATQPVTQQVTVFDSLGQQHTVVLTFTPNNGGGQGSWNVSASSPDLNGGAVNINGGGTFNMTFNSVGAMTSAGTLNLTATNGNPWFIPGTTTASNATQAQINLNLNNTAVGTLSSFAAASSVSQQQESGNPGQAGNSAGFLKSFSISPDGTIRGSYSNGTSKTLGQDQLATFTNPGGLGQIGQNDFDVSSDSGQANIAAPGSGAAGTVVQGSVETSNVQLADQLSEMILSERGFQANSKMISTSDEMLQDVVQMKR